MSLALLALAACSNLTPEPWGGDGTRYASGYAADFDGEEDTASGGDDTGGGGGGEEGAPELLTGAAIYTTNEADETFVLVGIAYTDEPDDVEGGNVYYALYADGQSAEESSRPIIETVPDPETEAYVDENDQIVFQVGPVDRTAEHELDVYVVDFTRNRSNVIGILVTSD